MSQYRTGLVTVTQDSPVVTGVGTAWLANVSTGDLFAVVGLPGAYEVAAIASDTELTLTAPWAGETAVEVAYTVTRDFSPNRGYPIAQPGDIEIARVMGRAIYEIDADVAALGEMPDQIESLSTAVTSLSSTVGALGQSLNDLGGDVTVIDGRVSELESEVQPLDRGGTGATDAAGARANLGLGSVATKDADNLGAIGGVSSINGGPLAGLRNKIINGDGRVSQRYSGAAPVGSSTGYYGPDRWAVRGTSLTGGSATIRSVLSEDTETWPGGRYIELSRTGYTEAGYLYQRIEDVRTLAGKKVTLSLVCASDLAEDVRLNVIRSFGSGGSSNESVANEVAATLTPGVAERASLTFDMPSLVGKTVGADSYIEIRIYPLGTGTGAFRYSAVQLEKGPVATPFEPRPFSLEHMLCQRYFQKSYPVGIAPGSFGASVIEYGMLDIRSEHENRDTLLMCVRFPVEMRAAPAVTPYSYLTGAPGKAATIGSSAADFDAQTVGTSPIGFRIRPSASLGVAPVRVGYLWAADAEL